MSSYRTLDVLIAAAWADIYIPTLTTFTRNTSLASAKNAAMKRSSRGQRMALLNCGENTSRDFRSSTYVKQ